MAMGLGVEERVAPHRTPMERASNRASQPLQGLQAPRHAWVGRAALDGAGAPWGKGMTMERTT